MKKIIIYLLLTSTLFAESVLEWQEGKSSSLVSFIEATNYCENLIHNSKDDWRLPDLVELTKLSKKITYKMNNKPQYYWSSTVNKTFKITAWFVSLSDDYQHFAIKKTKLNARCIRGSGKKMHYPACNNTKVKKTKIQKS